MLRKNLTYQYDYFGYMIYYKGSPIGGAGVIERKRKRMANLNHNKEMAEVTVSHILSGRVAPFMQKAIDRINDRKVH